MIELHSLEAEHGVLGAMLKQPHLISVLSEELSPTRSHTASTQTCIG
ncbi:hypothetical protein P4197_01055 [Pseudomonas aeruginosa]|nr:hypothetical protein [Pseudomonas aeruginosa]MDF5923137.1 hypothetical protein [Pseudomonas aeruginosa]